MISPGRVVLGVALVAIGVLFLLDGQGTLDAGEVISDWWPVLLIGLGGLQYLNDRHSAAPLILVGIGAVLLGIRLKLFGSDAWSIFWPLVLIGAGAWVLVGRRRTVGDVAGGSTFSAMALLSRRNIVVTDVFERGDITAIAGGAEVDLSSAALAAGAELTVTVLLGGCDIIIPEGWRATITGTPILGGWDDTTRRDAAGTDAPELAVRALAILGGIEVRHPRRWG